jgi:hypothetical protein
VKSAAVEATRYSHLPPENRSFIALIILNRRPYDPIPMADLRFSSLSPNKTSPSTSFSVRRICSFKMFEKQLEDAPVNLSHMSWLNPLFLSQLTTFSTAHDLGSMSSSPWSCREGNNDGPLTISSVFWAESMGGSGTKDVAVAVGVVPWGGSSVGDLVPFRFFLLSFLLHCNEPRLWH